MSNEGVKPMKQYKVGILGCGRSAWELHGYLLRNHPRFVITAAYDRDLAQAARYAQAFNARACDTLEEFLSSGLDLAVILTVSSAHAELAVRCLESGIHAFVTKPWAVSLAEADAMIAAAEKNGVQVYEVLAQQFEEDLRILQEMVASGAVGKVYRVQKSASTFGARNDWQTQKCLGGGYLNNWGPHLFGQAVSLLHEPVASVIAETRQIINAGDTEDMFCARLVTEAGTIIDVEYNIMADVLPNWVVQGGGGTIVARDHVIELYRVEQPESLIEGVYRNRVRVEFERAHYHPVDRAVIYNEMAEALDGTKPYRVSPQFSRRITQIIEAAHRSAECGQKIVLSERDRT